MRKAQHPYYPNLAKAMEGWVSPSGKTGLSQRRIAMDLEVPVSTLADSLSGRTYLQLSLALRIRDRYFPGEPIEQLFNVPSALNRA